MEVPGGSGLLGPHMRIGVLCEYALLSQDLKLSLMGIFDRVTVPGLPIQGPHFFLAAAFDPMPDDYGVRVELIDPTGANVFAEQQFEAPVNGQLGRLIAEFTLMPCEIAGRYDFNLYVGSERIGTISLTVEVGQPELLQGAPGVGQA